MTPQIMTKLILGAIFGVIGLLYLRKPEKRKLARNLIVISLFFYLGPLIALSYLCFDKYYYNNKTYKENLSKLSLNNNSSTSESSLDYVDLYYNNIEDNDNQNNINLQTEKPSKIYLILGYAFIVLYIIIFIKYIFS